MPQIFPNLTVMIFLLILINLFMFKMNFYLLFPPIKNNFSKLLTEKKVLFKVKW